MRKSILLSLLVTSSLFGAPRAIVFDFGGVMTGQPNRQAVISFLCETFQLSIEAFEKTNQQKRLALKEGVTDVEFWMKFAQEHDIILPSDWEEQFYNVMKQAIGVNQEMYTLVNQLSYQNTISIAMLSNIDERLAKLIRSYNLYAPFHLCLLSCEIGVEKPDPKAYQVLIDSLGVEPEEIIFIDDTNENIDAACKAGIDAILFESVAQIGDALKQRGLL